MLRNATSELYGENLAVTLIKSSFSAGELSPSIWGRVDLASWHIGASVMRNVFVSYRGPASSRAGLAWVCQSLTPASASSIPPRIIRFQFNVFQSYILEFGVNAAGMPYMRVIANGAPVTEPPVAVTGITQANPGVVTALGHGFANGDWVYGSSIGGMTQLNGRTAVVANATANTFAIQDTFGNPINTLTYGAWTAGGTYARIYTNFNSPYAVADLPYLKVVQSADVMSLCCVNQVTGTEYPPFDLSRLAAANWSFVQTTFASAISPPTGCTASTTITASPATQYAYCVTAVDAVTGEESIASNIAYITNSDDIALVAGSHLIGWATEAGAAYYNIYQAPPSYDTAVPVGSVFAYIGTAFGNQFVNTNILADQTQTPPQHNDPFARSQILSVGTIPGTGSFAQATTTAAITTATGTGGVIAPVVVGSAVVAGIVDEAGQGYASTDTVTFTDSGSGNSVTAPLVIGPATGTYPSVVGYFQQRRDYANTLNNPDTLFYSQTGAYTNMDSSVPPVDSDAIITTPWGQQVNGVQWTLPMPGGDIVATGLDCWQYSGAQGAGSALTPASQNAQPQESNGFSATVGPIKANYNIIYLQAFGNVVRDIEYNFFTNIYTGTDVSLLSNHLFQGFQVTQWAWSKIPWKMVWATRDDGRFLSFTFDKEEKLQGWARHDTNGLVVGNEVATEPPVDAPYFVVKRFIRGYNAWAYYIERMDNRNWEGPEDPWCIDAGLALPQPAPNAALTAAAATGPGTITGGYIASGGINNTGPVGTFLDPIGTGSGASITFTLTGGVITGFVIVPGQNYSPGTQCVITDPTGSGGTLVPFISQNVIFNASAPVFSATNPGDVIRVGGGQATVTAVPSPTQVLAAITVPILAVIPNDPYLTPAPAAAGTWTITAPVTSVTGLWHLEGMLVTGLADGAVIPPVTVVNGTVPLAAAASSIKVGLGYIAQLQSMPTEVQQAGSVQGRKKRSNFCAFGLEKTRGVQVGGSQPVASALDFQQEIPWSSLVDLPDVPRSNVPDAALPLFTGYKGQMLNDNWQNFNGWEANPGMISAQQSQPLPMNVLSMVPEMSLGDNAGAPE